MWSACVHVMHRSDRFTPLGPHPCLSPQASDRAFKQELAKLVDLRPHALLVSLQQLACLLSPQASDRAFKQELAKLAGNRSSLAMPTMLSNPSRAL